MKKGRQREKERVNISDTFILEPEVKEGGECREEKERKNYTK